MSYRSQYINKFLNHITETIRQASKGTEEDYNTTSEWLTAPAEEAPTINEVPKNITYKYQDIGWAVTYAERAGIDKRTTNKMRDIHTRMVKDLRTKRRTETDIIEFHTELVKSLLKFETEALILRERSDIKDLTTMINVLQTLYPRNPKKIRKHIDRYNMRIKSKEKDIRALKRALKKG